MQTHLFKYAVIQSDLTWAQVVEAERKAKASEAAKHFHFYKHSFLKSNEGGIKRWSLLAMPAIYQEWINGADASGWWIEIADPGPEPLHT